MSIRALLMSLVGLLVLACMASFLVWLDSDPVSRQEGGANSFLAPQKAYACIQLATRTPTPSRTPVLAFTPTPTPIPAANKFVDGNYTGGNQDGNSWENAYRDISTAITNVSTNGVIYVAEGTYTNNYTVNKAVSIFGGFRVNHSTKTAKGRDPQHYCTIVIANSGIPVTSNNVTIDGLYLYLASVQIGPIITCTNYSNLKIRNCWFQHDSNHTGTDGGVYLSGSSGFLFQDCVFHRVSTASYAGAVAVYNCGTGNKFERCIFTENWSSGTGGNGYGGAVYCSASSVDITNCLFAKNTATNQGSALYFTGAGTYNLNHCTLSLNGTSGGSIVTLYQDNPSVVNVNSSIIYGNYHSSGTQITYETYNQQTPPVTYSCIGGTGVLAGTGNKNIDPLFYRPEFDWHLRPDSPCLNAADPSSTVTVDLSGNNRTNPFGAYYDMGCYEWPDPKFFGVVEQVLPSPFSFRVQPGFPENIAEPYFVVPEQIDEYISTLDDLGVKSIEVFLPWAFIEVLPGQNSAQPDSPPVFENPVYLWDDNGDYNVSGIGAVTASDWNYNLQNPYDEWPSGNGPTWPKSDLKELLLNTTFQKQANLGYFKMYLEQWANYTRDFFNELHDHGIEIALAIEQAPAWRVTKDPKYPYTEAFDILGCGGTIPEQLRWFTTLYFNDYIQGTMMDDADDGYPGLKKFVTYIEKQFPYIDYYTPWQEIELNFPRETPEQTPNGTPTPAVKCYRHEECYKILKAIKEAISSNSANAIYINVFEQYSEANNGFGIPWSRDHLEYIHGLIDQAGNDIVVGNGTPTPLPVDKVRKLGDTLKIIGINVPHGIGGEDSVVGMSPFNTAKRGQNRLNFSLADQYGPPGYSVKTLDYFEVWDQENSVYRGCNHERGPLKFTPLLNQLDDPDDQNWGADTAYETAYMFLHNPGITRSRYTYSIDTRTKKVNNWFDSGLFDFPFSIANKSTVISGNTNATSWIHPITGIAGGNPSSSYDYYYGDHIVHYPAYYSLKCLMRNLNEPKIPYIASFSVTQSNGVPGSIVFSDPAAISITVTMSEPIYGYTWLLIDGLTVAGSLTVPSTNLIHYTFTDLTPGDPPDLSLSVESKYHRMSVVLEDRFAGLGSYHASTIGNIETGYRFIPIIYNGSDYASSGNAPVPFQQWDFSVNPFPAATPTGSNTPTRTAQPTPTLLTPTPWFTEGPTPYATMTQMSKSWNRRSFVSQYGAITPTIAPTMYIAWNSGAVQMTGGGACAICNYDRPCHNGICCNNYNALTPTPACWNGTPTPIMPAQTYGPYATPTATGTCNFNNHECNPICSLNNFEGGEMWNQISTVGFYDIVVEMTIRASGMSSIPHGMRPVGYGYRDRKDAVLSNDIFRPYYVCQDLKNFGNCADAYLIEEVLTIMFTTDYDPPYEKDGSPLVVDSVLKTPRGIANWTTARMIPRSVLITDYYGSSKTIRVDFSAWNNVDNNDHFGLWIRSQLDSTENQVIVDDIKVFGKRIHQN